MASLPIPGGSMASAAPLPPLPDLQAAPPQNAPSGLPAGMAQILSGIAPVKSAVDQIQSACKQIVQSGVIPGAEQICGQIIALAGGLLPMAAQNMMQPGPGAPGGGMSPMPPSPAGPPDLGGM